MLISVSLNGFSSKDGKSKSCHFYNYMIMRYQYLYS